MYRNSEGYKDPTAGAAMYRIACEERQKRKKAREARREAVRKQRKELEKQKRLLKKKPIHWVKAWPK